MWGLNTQSVHDRGRQSLLEIATRYLSSQRPVRFGGGLQLQINVIGQAHAVGPLSNAQVAHWPSLSDSSELKTYIPQVDV